MFRETPPNIGALLHISDKPEAANATRDEIVSADGRCTVVVGDIRERETLAAAGWYARADGKGWTNMPNET